MENTVVECQQNFDEKKPLHPTDHHPLPLKIMVDKCLTVRFHPDTEIFQFKHETCKRRHHQNFEPSSKHLENREKSTDANDNAPTNKNNTIALYKSTIHTIFGLSQIHERLPDVSNIFSVPIYINHFVGQSEPNEMLVIWGPRCMWLQSCIGKRIIEPWRIDGIPANVDFMTLKQAIAQQKFCWYVINSNYVRVCVRISGGGEIETRRQLSNSDETLNEDQFNLIIQILQLLNDCVSKNMQSLDGAAQKYRDKIKDNSLIEVNSGQNYLALARAVSLCQNSIDFTIKLAFKGEITKYTSKLTRIVKVKSDEGDKKESINVTDHKNHRYSWKDLSTKLAELATEMRQYYEQIEKFEIKNIPLWQQRLLGHQQLALEILKVVFVNTESEFLSSLSDKVEKEFLDTVHQFLSLSLVIETYRLPIVLPIWLIDIISIARGDRLRDGQPLTFSNMLTNVVENEDGTVDVFYIPRAEKDYHGYIVPTYKKLTPKGANQSQRGLHIATCSGQFGKIKKCYGKEGDIYTLNEIFRNIKEVNQDMRKEYHHSRLDYIGGILTFNSVARFFNVASITSKDVKYKVGEFIYVLDKLFHDEKIPLEVLVSVSTPETLLENIAAKPKQNIAKSTSKYQSKTTEIPESYRNAFKKLNTGFYKLKEAHEATFNGYTIFIAKNKRKTNTPWWYKIKGKPAKLFFCSFKVVLAFSYQELQNIVYEAEFNNYTIFIAEKKAEMSRLWWHAINDRLKNAYFCNYEVAIKHSYHSYLEVQNKKKQKSRDDDVVFTLESLDIQTLMSHWEIEPVEGMANQWLDCDQDKLLRLMLRKIQEANIDTNDIYILTPVDANKTPGWITQELKMSCPEQKQRYLYTVIPINFSNSHWVTVVIHHNHHDSSQPKVYLFDPLGLHDDKVEILTSILKNTRVYTNPNMIHLLTAEEKPLQEDDYTCGTWMLESINRIIAGLNDNLGIKDIKESIQNISSLDLKDIHEQNLKAPELQ